MLDLRLVRRNFAWTAAANVVYTGCQWLMLVVLARLGDPAMVGRFTLGLAIAAPVFMFTSLQLRSVEATDARGEFRFSDYLGLQLIASLVGLSLVALICLAARYRWDVALVILAVGLAKAVESLSEVCFGLMQRHERMDWISWAISLKAPVALLVMGAALRLTGSVLWFAAGMAGAWALCLLTYEAALVTRLLPKERLLPRFHPPVLRKLAWMALPLGFVLMLTSLNANVPRYFVERYFGERELGIFAAMAYVTLGLHTVARSLAISGVASLARHHVEGDAQAFRKLVVLLAGGGLLIGLLGVLAARLAGHTILSLLYGREYAGDPDVFVWLMVGAGISFVAYSLQQALTAARCLQVQAYLFGGAAALTTTACLLLVPRFGLNGAAWATIVSAALQALGGLYILRHALRAMELRPAPTGAAGSCGARPAEVRP